MKNPCIAFAIGCLTGVSFLAAASAATIEPAPFRVPAKLPDRAETLSPSAVHISGWLGERVNVNEKNRLLTIDTRPLLAGFHKKPGSQGYIGEHVGKWMHAATLAWAYTSDPALKEKIDRTAAELVACQEPDGYLGTYVPEKRFGLYPDADWDVSWRKYNLLGLLTYSQYTGDEAALNACRKMADLLIATFPGKRSFLAAGEHVGMAATSVLEPVVLLYRMTGDPRYLEFARYIVKSWDEPNGPRIISSLLAGKGVNKIADAKAYEMLSNLVGVCEFARVTGNRTLLEAVQKAWTDIATNRLYATGSASRGECFPADHVLPNGNAANICETCATVTWIQLNLQLLRLTGEAKYSDEIEKSLYNHLAAAQHPQGCDWVYYTPLEGKKNYDAGITCCHSSGPRNGPGTPNGLFLKMHDGRNDVLAISTFETSRATMALGGQTVTIEQRSEFPRRGSSTITFHMAKPAKFRLCVRKPTWAAPVRLRIYGANMHTPDFNGWAFLGPIEWHDGDHCFEIDYAAKARLIPGEYGNEGLAALAWGPFVLAYDEKLNPGLPGAGDVGLIRADPPCTLKPGGPLAFEAKVIGFKDGKRRTAIFVPFADAGSTGGAYRVWLPLKENP